MLCKWIFFILVKSYSVPPVRLQCIMKKLCSCVFKVSIDHPFDNREKKNLLFWKESGKSLEFEIRNLYESELRFGKYSKVQRLCWRLDVFLLFTVQRYNEFKTNYSSLSEFSEWEMNTWRRKIKKRRKEIECLMTEFESFNEEGVSEMQDASPVIMKLF